MKRPTHEAAKSLGIHPANLVLYLTYLGAPFQDCWPSVDDGWIETLRQTHKTLVNKTNQELPHQHSPLPSTAKTKYDLSKSALKILDKLHRKKDWGSHTVSWRTIHNDYCPKVPNLEDAVEELLRLNLLLGSSINDPLSLNPAMKKQIEEFVEQFRSEQAK